jgi:hypothetical protein
MRLAILILLGFYLPTHAGEILGDDFNEDDNHEYASLPKLRLSGQTGYSKWLFSPDSLSKSYNRYLDKLEQGQTTNAELAYFFWPRGGLGISWIWFVSRASDSGITEIKGNPTLHKIQERVSVNYLGPDFLTRLHTSQNSLLVGGLGVGYLFFHETGIDNARAFSVTAENFAIQAHVGAEYSIWRFLAVGFEGRLFFSNLREYKYNGVKYKLKDPNNQFIWYNVPLYRLELSAGLHLLL